MFWVFVGFILGLLAVWGFRAFFGSAQPPSPGQPCPRCGRRISSGYDHCEWCALDLRSPTGRELADLKATERQLKRFLGFGVLDASILEAVQREIAVRYRRLAGRKDAPVPQSQPFLPFPQPSSLPLKPQPQILTA